MKTYHTLKPKKKIPRSSTNNQTGDPNETFRFNPSNFPVLTQRTVDLNQKIAVTDRRLLVRSTRKAYNTAIITHHRLRQEGAQRMPVSLNISHTQNHTLNSEHAKVNRKRRLQTIQNRDNQKQSTTSSHRGKPTLKKYRFLPFHLPRNFFPIKNHLAEKEPTLVPS